MLTAFRALGLNSSASPELPRLPALRSLYGWGLKVRRGEFILVTGRSGQMKSGFVLWMCQQWGLDTLYFSADSSAYTMGVRLASMTSGFSQELVEADLAKVGGAERTAHFDRLAKESGHIKFSFGSPITFTNVDLNLNAYVEVKEKYPDVIVIDNLMDVEDADSDASAQAHAMQEFAALCRNTGSTVIVLHHATENTMRSSYEPPIKKEILNKVDKKPELILGVGFQDCQPQPKFRVAVLKQRMGRSDPEAHNAVTLNINPNTTTFAEEVNEWQR